ncbi:MAG: hypothetical protein H8E26_13095 [FCB group bacterium]|nr:hypothetical protein [FCB group bacterium]
MKFPGYTFETLDTLQFSRVVEIYASCQWLFAQEGKANDSVKRRGKA